MEVLYFDMFLKVIFKTEYLLIISGILCQYTEAAQPVFTTPGIPGRTVPVSETVQTGTSVYRIIAVDADNDLLVYSMTSQLPSQPLKFSVDSRTGVIATLEGFDVDFQDAITKYQISVRVTDGLSSIQTSLFMEIIDENDNSPQFMHYFVIREKTKPGSIIADMCAKDIDSDKNSRVIYDIKGGNSNNAFRIDSQTGVLYTMYELNRTLQDSYKIIVEARDSGATPRSSTATVTISLSSDVSNDSSKYHLNLITLFLAMWTTSIVPYRYLCIV